MKQKLLNILHPVIFTTIGCALGFAYYTYVGCPTGSCPITSSLYSTMAYTGLIGLLVSYVLRQSR